MKKYSYRTLTKRRYAENVLFALKHPEEIKENLKFFNHDRYKDEAKRAINTAKQLIKDLKRGYRINLIQFSPFVNEIKKELSENTNKAI